MGLSLFPCSLQPQPSSKSGHETNVAMSDAQRRDAICLHLLGNVMLAQENLAVGLRCQRPWLCLGLRKQQERNELGSRTKQTA